MEMEKMNAMVYSKYGPATVLHMQEVDMPQYNKDEVLIRVRATAVNSGDIRLRNADPFILRLFFGLTRPKKGILGTVFSGEIEKIGKDVVGFKVGDAVFGSSHLNLDTYAEYLSFPALGALALKPNNITHEEAAAIPFGGTTALYWIKKANIKPNQKVLVFGASGAVGTAAVQLARYFGAEVTAVCSGSNFDLVQSLGAAKMVDYTKTDFTKNGIKYDVIFDTVGKISYSAGLISLKKDGKMILSAAGGLEMLRGLFTSSTSGKKVLSGMIKIGAKDIIFLKDLIEAGIMSPVIDRTYAMANMVEAHKYVEKGHKKGNVAITV
jgi:NADPH:quinone reductase-like Zn-dependent oxidoreductase